MAIKHCAVMTINFPSKLYLSIFYFVCHDTKSHIPNKLRLVRSTIITTSLLSMSYRHTANCCSN